MINPEYVPLTSIEDMNAKLSAAERLSFLYMAEVETNEDN